MKLRVKDKFTPHGLVEILVLKGAPTLIPGKLIRLKPTPIYESCAISYSDDQLISKQSIKNLIADQGKDQLISGLATGTIKTLCRMAVGDRGTIPSDSQTPKVPVNPVTALYNEVFRGDVDVVTLNIGTPGTHEIKLIKTFAASDIPVTSFSNQASPVVNEVALILADLFLGAPLPRADVAAPALPPADEELFSIRTFKSIPFDVATDISVTIRYTIFIE